MEKKVLIENIIKSKIIMDYDVRKTYTENLFFEQITSYERYLDRTFEDPKKAQKFIDQNIDTMKGLYNWFASLNSHDWLSLIEISTGILGLIPTPLSPILLGVSFVAGVSDAGVYFSEGDPYMGTIMLALSVIPGGELYKVLKGSKVLTKRGIKGTISLIKKYKSGVKLTTEELDDITKLGIEFSKNASEVTPLLKNSIRKNIAKYVADKSPKFLMNLLLFLKKIGVIKLSDILFKVGGTVYGFDKLYLFIFRDSIFANKEILDSRTKNELRATINHLLGYEKEVNDFIRATTQEKFEHLDEQSTKYNLGNDLNVPENPDTSFIQGKLKELKQKNESDRREHEKSLQSPSTDEIISGKKIVKLNQKGDSVKEIQKMLHKLDYDYLLTNFDTYQNWNDGIYGKSTMDAVTSFQEDNNLKPNGIVDKNTLLKLKELYNNKLNGDNEKK
jgi:Putative peptidoglycan binding domain